MQAHMKTITPEIAESWLKKNTLNRPIKPHHVLYLSREMEARRWKENGESIKWSGTKLIDGQHRLLACVKSKVSFRTLVVEGLSDDTFDTIDTGIPRSGSDTLAVRGEKNCKRLSAALVIVERYMTGTMETVSRKFSNAEIEGLLEKYPEIRDSANRTEFVSRLAPPSLMTACHFLFAQKDAALADEFMRQVLRGSNLKDSDPAYILRERLVRNSLSKAKLTPSYVAALFIKAWNHKRKLHSIKYLRYREHGEKPETFPLVE